jgi:amino-acid N-acetyltransferase
MQNLASSEPLSASVDTAFSVRRARTSDVPWIQELVEPLVQRRILLGKDLVVFYEAVQEFYVAVDAGGQRIGCGARVLGGSRRGSYPGGCR